MARKLAFEKGIEDWLITIDGVMDSASWEIYSTKEKQIEHPNYSSGKVLTVNLESGKFKIFDWVSGE